ncbi:glycerol-3-phosphate dehydrogenase [Alginatibacterium sediminis]|uniref:Glycerol-3-phosphate dehydrogenase n=1 Tax=Alginatibacterium sediminis TaxID=2164068 RepID=A0A420E6M1_9ALTE|nr:glycerol-3-phosphate dehydrogenase [Alginatibacterium sediminis]RKF13281.1 glycerol-3-phosphate dehydrogenase [Alginatibacterium sediminis]
MATTDFDIIVVGGGINGVGIAADAAGRGLKTALFEQQDLASATSSASSKLIHGGLRYLEHYEFRLVSEALKEREVLLQLAPHIATPMRFRLPHRPHLRPWWMIRAGLFLYDNLASRSALPGCTGLKFGEHSALNSKITSGFEYSDCWVDDARLVILNARLAKEHGALIKTQHKVISAERQADHWEIEVECQQTATTQSYTCKALVNAAGPWVQSFFEQELKAKPPRTIRLVKGSHIVVPKIHDEPQAYILQNEDQRIVFVIPYQNDFSLIGTTDVEFTGNARQVHISAQETEYLCDVVNQHFKKQISPADVVHSFAGVRPLCQDESSDPSAVTRDYTLELSEQHEGAPLLSVFGGKLTTYRKLAEAALEQITTRVPAPKPAWTKSARLPGAHFSGSRDNYFEKVKRAYPQLPETLLRRWVNQYGSEIPNLLNGASTVEQLGQHFGADLYLAEVNYLREYEWAITADDILWRRTKTGLEMSSEEQQQLATHLKPSFDALRASI